ncbi:NYN domain-containing protein [Microcoleus sp. LEGE 07076]|nr:NYN domain-containing protein [Microcoleus sp. LEGE 07076]
MENRLDAIGSIQERVLTLEKAQLQQQITQLQQWASDLDDRADELGDRALQLDQVQQQLAVFKRLASVPAKTGRGRVAIFIDGANLFYAIQELGIRIDYTKFLKLLVGDDNLFRAFYYTGVEAADEKQHGFLLWMRHHGFRVVSKPVLQRPDGSKKANLDVEMAMDIVSLAGQYDTVVLVGGDGDLACALDKVSAQRARVEVVSLRSMTSEALIDVADSYVDLEEIKGKICKSAN